MKKRSILVIGVALSLFLVFMAIRLPITNLSTTSPSAPELNPFEPIPIVQPAKSPIEQIVDQLFGGGGGGSGAPPVIQNPDRIIVTTTGMLVKISEGRMNAFVVEVETLVYAIDGYIAKQTILYQNEKWDTTIIIKVPLNKTNSFVFTVSEKIEAFGKLIECRTETEDVTEAVESEEIEMPKYNTLTIRAYEGDIQKPNEFIVAIMPGVNLLTSTLALVVQAIIVIVPLTLIISAMLWIFGKYIVPRIKVPNLPKKSDLSIKERMKNE